jgi:hypothetical protein
MTGLRGASLDWDRRGAGNAAIRPRPRKPGPTLSLRDEQSHWREPRWNAGRRARLARRAPRREVRRFRNSVFRRSASFFLPWLSFVASSLASWLGFNSWLQFLACRARSGCSRSHRRRHLTKDRALSFVLGSGVGIARMRMHRENGISCACSAHSRASGYPRLRGDSASLCAAISKGSITAIQKTALDAARLRGQAFGVELKETEF